MSAIGIDTGRDLAAARGGAGRTRYRCGSRACRLPPVCALLCYSAALVAMAAFGPNVRGKPLDA